MASIMVVMLHMAVVVMVEGMVEGVMVGTEEEEGVMEGMVAMEEEEDMMGMGAMADRAEVEVSQLRKVTSVRVALCL